LRLRAFQGFVFLIIALSAAGRLAWVHGQDPRARDANSPPVRGNPIFSVSNADDIKHLEAVRRAAAVECVRVLQLRARGELREETGQAERAANVLALLGSPFPSGLAALCQNLTLRSTKIDTVDALGGLPAANALVAIGGRRTAQALFESMSGDVDRHGLLIRAHILARIEPTEVAVKRIGLAIEELQRKMGIKESDRARHLKNLRQVESWLKEPEILSDVKNWPSRTL
jgi:hypothetical protein